MDDFDDARQVHVGRSNDGRLGLFDADNRVLLIQLEPDENPEILARGMGWRLVQA